MVLADRDDGAHRDNRLADGLAGAPVPDLERVRAAAQDGRGLGVAEVVPQDKLERFAVGGPQRVERGADLLVPRMLTGGMAGDGRRRRGGILGQAGVQAEPPALERRWSETVLRATPNSQRRSPGGDGTSPKRRQATVNTWAITSSASPVGTRRST